MHRTWRKFLLWGTTTVFFFGALSFVIIYHLKLLFSESLYLEKGSYAYYFLIPEEIRKLPLWRPTSSSVFYYYDAIDGMKPLIIGIRYETPSSQDEIINEYRTYFSSKHYTDESREFLGHSSHELAIVVNNQKGRFFVYIKFLERSKHHKISIDFIPQTHYD